MIVTPRCYFLPGVKFGIWFWGLNIFRLFCITLVYISVYITMTRIKFFLMMFAIFSPAFMRAGEYSRLTFTLVDNTELSVVSENLSINYSNGELYLTSNTVDQVIPVENIRSMKFTNLTSDIDNLAEEKAIGEKDFFTISGNKVGTFGSIDEAREKLPSGIYLISDGSNTLKVIF